MWYIIIIAVVCLCLTILVKSFRRINRLSEDGTLLVAYTKEAMYKTYLGKDIPFDEQYSKLMRACYLFNIFLGKTNGLRETYSFSIRENGPVYGETKIVQLSSFINTVWNRRCLANEMGINTMTLYYILKIENSKDGMCSKMTDKYGIPSADLAAYQRWLYSVN